MPALLYGLIAQHSIWYPVNLLGGAGVAHWRNPTTAEIAAFHWQGLLVAIVIHSVTCLLVGLLYGAMLPMLPRHPVLLGGILAPVLWTGILHSFMGIINPALADRIAWGWFLVSQVTYGVVAGIVVARQERVPTGQSLPFAARLGIEAPGMMDSRPDAGPSRRGEALMRSVATALLACSAALFGGCARAPGYPPNPMLRPTAITDFATLYGQNCAACHGAKGQNGPAIDLANPEYQALVDDATLRKWISGGMPGTEMPAFAQSAGGMLTDAQVNALIAGMRKQWSTSECFEWSDASAIRADNTWRSASRRASLHGALRHVPRTGPEQSPQQITSPALSGAGGRPGAAHHRHRGPPGYRAARLAPRRSGRQCSRAALRTGCGRHRSVSCEPAEHGPSSHNEHGVGAIGNRCAGREVRDMSQEEHPLGGDPNRSPSGIGDAARHDDPRIVSRRWLLFKAAIALNGLVGLVLAVPVLRYLLAPWRKDSSYDSWVSLGPVDAFPAGETRLAFYKNPSADPWDGQTDNVACYVRHEGAINSRSSPSTARTSAARCAGFRSRSFSCVPATAASTMPTARALRDRPSADSSLTTGRWFPASCASTPARCRRFRTQLGSSTSLLRHGDCPCQG